jgi:hypothetical protein
VQARSDSAAPAESVAADSAASVMEAGAAAAAAAATAAVAEAEAEAEATLAGEAAVVRFLL